MNVTAIKQSKVNCYTIVSIEKKTKLFNTQSSASLTKCLPIKVTSYQTVFFITVYHRLHHLHKKKNSLPIIINRSNYFKEKNIALQNRLVTH